MQLRCDWERLGLCLYVLTYYLYAYLGTICLCDYRVDFIEFIFEQNLGGVHGGSEVCNHDHHYLVSRDILNWSNTATIFSCFLIFFKGIFLKYLIYLYINK